MGYVVRARHGSPRRHLVSLGLVAAFGAMYVAEHYPGEKFHMFQYGVLGLLLFGALRVDLDPRGVALYAVGISIGAVAGLVDELIQHLLPNRVFTPHDVVVNGASVALVLVFLRVHARPAEALEREIS